VVGMRVRIKDVLEFAHPGLQHLGTKIGAGIDNQVISTWDRDEQRGA